MNPHLPDERISRWILGERTAAEELHVRECAACRAEVARMTAALAQFRDAVRQWGEVPRRPRGRQTSPLRLRWALAALILMAALWPVHSIVSKRRQLEAARADAILLEQVDAGVSRAIARPMEPLAKLMTWDSNQKNEGIR
jgi:hypothetical protein